ncbi:MAG: hypothetical protein ABI678_27320, partial [Kofleriaceae bacterium]
SPEQARNEHLDPRSDVFSVGILMWELVCGRPLYSRLGDLEALRAVREPRIQRPSEIDPRLPPEIDEIVMIALARDKTRRYASAGVLGAKLRSLRYSLDTTSGDPATELARIVASTEELERTSEPPSKLDRRSAGLHDFDHSESTVIRIQTADAFSARDNESSIVAARKVIDQFEDEETRLAQVGPDQLRMLRSAREDSGEGPAPTVYRKRARAPSDEATRAVAPIDFDERERDSERRGFDDDPPTTLPVTPIDGNTPPHQHFAPTEETRLFQSRDRRTPRPQPIARDPISERSRSASVSKSVSPHTASAPSGRGKPPTNPGPQHPSAIIGPQSMGPPATLPGQPVPGAPVAIAGAPISAHQPAVPSLVPGPKPNLVLPQGVSNWGPPLAAQMPAAYPPQRPSIPSVAGFQKKKPPAKPALQPWMLVAGAILVAILAFVITRAFIS